jgi:hypothetical protein
MPTRSVATGGGKSAAAVIEVGVGGLGTVGWRFGRGGRPRRRPPFGDPGAPEGGGGGGDAAAGFRREMSGSGSSPAAGPEGGGGGGRADARAPMSTDDCSNLGLLGDKGTCPPFAIPVAARPGSMTLRAFTPPAADAPAG